MCHSKQRLDGSQDTPFPARKRPAIFSVKHPQVANRQLCPADFYHRSPDSSVLQYEIQKVKKTI